MDIGSVPGEIVILPGTGGVTGTPRRLLGLMGPSGRRGEAAKGQPRAPPLPPTPNWTRRGAVPPPLSFPLSPPSPQVLIQLGKRRGVLLPPGVGLLLGRVIERAGPPPPPLLYIRGKGHPMDTQVDQLIF